MDKSPTSSILVLSPRQPCSSFYYPGLHPMLTLLCSGDALPSRLLASGAFNKAMLIIILVLCIPFCVGKSSAMLKVGGHG